MNRFESLGAALVLLAATAGTHHLAAQTTLEYSNGGPDYYSTAALNYQWAADFELQSATALTGLNFWTVDWEAALPIVGAYRWRIFESSVAGGVGTELYSGSVAPDRTDAGVWPNHSGYRLFANWVDLPSARLDGGSYWLSLSGPAGVPSAWATAAANGTAPSYYDTQPYDATDTWTRNSREVAFELYGEGDVVPEPASVLLLATGLLGIGGLAWRRRG